MFRRLTEALGGSVGNKSREPFASEHVEYIQDQDKYFKTLNNLIPSATSGLPNFDKAIQTADSLHSGRLQTNPIEHANDIFRAVPSPDLANMAYVCSSSSLDELIASKNPSDKIGCGWLYTPPNPNSPYPIISKGFLGKIDGPTKAFDPPAHKQWFFDLEAAKKQILLDKCKALKSCTDLDHEAYKGQCGFCQHTNQGVPISSTGQPLYPSDPRGGCDTEAIVRSASQCPPPPPPPPGPAPIVDRTCDPVNGRLGAECLRRQVVAAGCNERGSLALALSGSPPPNDYIYGLRDSAAVKLYQRVSQPPLNLDIFTQGRATTQQVLQEARQLVGNTTKPESSGLGLAARDLCLRRGAFEKYDICSEISDSQGPPYDLSCLQRLFLKVGGNPSGKMYPSAKTHNHYNSFATWGEVNQYLQQMYRKMYANTPSGPLKEGFQDAGKKYEDQRQAMIDLLGIVPEKGIQRVPYRQGVEVFWLVPGEVRWNEGKPCEVNGILRRTIERDIVQLQPGPSRIPQIGGGPCGSMLQLMDVRAQEDASVRFQVNIDDGFWIAVNQPNSKDAEALNRVNGDEPGFFENNWYQGPTWYGSQACTPFSSSTPNIVKMFFQDSGCGWHSFLVNTTSCSGKNPFTKPQYSLTSEEKAPFLAFEVNRKTGKFEELRIPAVVDKLVYLRGLTPYTRYDDRQTVPGKKAFVRLNSVRSAVDIHNVAYQSWKTISFAVRFQTMPVKETIIGLAMGPIGTLYYNIIASNGGGNSISISIEHFFGGSDKKNAFRSGLQLNKWYLFFIHNHGNAFTLYCDDMAETVRSKKNGGNIGYLSLYHTGPLYSPNATWWPKHGSGQPFEACTITVGTEWFASNWKSYYASSGFEYDLAWVHFFDYFTLYANDDLYRDCMGDWKYTQFPTAYQKFETLVED